MKWLNRSGLVASAGIGDTPLAGATAARDMGIGGFTQGCPKLAKVIFCDLAVVLEHPQLSHSSLNMSFAEVLPE